MIFNNQLRFLVYHLRKVLVKICIYVKILLTNQTFSGSIFYKNMILCMIFNEPPFNFQKTMENAKNLQQPYDTGQQHISQHHTFRVAMQPVLEDVF